MPSLPSLPFVLLSARAETAGLVVGTFSYPPNLSTAGLSLTSSTGETRTIVAVAAGIGAGELEIYPSADLTSGTWTLAAGAGVTTGPLSDPIVPGSAQFVVALLAADFLALFDRIFPPSYLEPLKEVGPGYELFQAFAAVAQRMALAVSRAQAAGLVITALGGQKARATVTFTRSLPATLAVTVQAGTVVRASNGERDFVLLADVAFAALDVGPHNGTVEAVAMGYEWNVPGPRLTAAGVTLPGEIDTILTPHLSPPYGDTTFEVAQAADATGGRDAVLDQLGLDRAMPRFTGESDAVYAARLAQLPDTVSPGAFARLLAVMLAPYGVTATLIEVSDLKLQTCWDAPPAPIPSSPDYSPEMFVYDDPRTVNPVPGGAPFFNRWLPHTRLGGIVLIPALQIRDQGMAYDDTANTVAAFATRAVSAWDVPFTLIAQEVQGAWDGQEFGANAVYYAIWTALQAIKAAGVPLYIALG